MRLIMEGMRLSGQVKPVIIVANNRYVTFSSEKINIKVGNDSNLLVVFYVQIMPDDFVMQLHRF